MVVYPINLDKIYFDVLVGGIKVSHDYNKIYILNVSKDFMNYEKLRKLNDVLVNQFKDYISMTVIGSIATGDPYIEGRSDKDILLIFKNSPKKSLGSIEEILSKMKFNESYNFVPIPKTVFDKAEENKYAFSNRFRSKILFGEDIMKNTKLPPQDSTKEMYEREIEKVIHKLQFGLTNSSHWSVNKVRDKFWKQFKHAFMYLAIKDYYDTQDYPRTRKEITKRIQSKEIDIVFRVLHSIDQQPKGEIIKSARGLLFYLESSD